MIGLFIKFYPNIFLKGNDHGKTDDDHIGLSESYLIFNYVLLAYIPLGIALSNILLRKMKGLHFIQLSVFKITFALIVAIIISALTGDKLTILKKFKLVDYVYVIVGSLF